MKKQDYNATIVVKTTAAEAFKYINHVSAWWTENLEGSSARLNDVFTVRFGETFVTFRITEFVPAKKVVWLVTDSNLHWLYDKKEWNGTSVRFELSGEKDATSIHFTHIGLLPGIECYNNCKRGWDEHIKDSLFGLISEGKGLPQKRTLATAN